MSRFRSLSETRRPRSFYSSEDGGPSSRDADSDLIPMVRNCSSCLDLYHRMIGMSVNDLSPVERSGDGVAIGARPNQEVDPQFRETMGEANDYEVPQGGADRGTSPSPATTETGSCVFLFKKGLAKWRVGRDWQDFFDFHLVITRDTRDQASGPSEPFQRDFAHGVQDEEDAIEESEDNGIDALVQSFDETRSAPSAVQFDKSTNTTKDQKLE